MTISVDDNAVRTHRVTGGGGVQLCVEETGNRSGRPVLFLHGLSQSRLAWRGQLQSELTRDLRLVALDLRGHGESERPDGAYGDPALWAQDVAAVIRTLELDRPVLSGWSYGGVLIGDYLSRYGEDTIGGVHLVGAICGLGEPALPFLGPKFLAAIPGLFSTDAEESVTCLRAFGRLVAGEPMTVAEEYLLLGTAVATPPRVRQALLDRTVDHDGLLAGLRVPVLISHGLDDEVVLPVMADHNARIIRHAQVSYYAGVGHAPFWSDPDRFNGELLAFATSL